jgi:uncharacterized protein (DUF58 family)
MHLATRLIKLLPLSRALASRPSEGQRTEPFGPDFERKLEMLAQLSRRTNGQVFRAERRSKRRGSGVEFADYRDYVAGDDFRFIDPNAALRLDRLLLRLYEEEEDQSIYLLVDASRSMGHNRSSKLDYAKRLAAAIAYICLTELDRVTVVALAETCNLQHPTTRGRGQFLSILRYLRAIEPSGKTGLEFTLRRFVSQHRRRGIAVLLSDLFDPDGFERGLDVLRYERFEPHVLHITDDQDLDPELVGDVTVVDCETGHESAATVTPALKARLRAAQLRLVERAQRHCRTHGLGYHQSEAGSAFEDTIQQLLGRQGRLRT